MNITKADIGDKETLQRLMQAYLHDLSPYTGDAVGADGRYNLGKYFDCYWTEPQRYPYLFKDENGGTVGFALVREVEGGGHAIAEFSISAAYRGKGLGRRFAWMLFERHPGKWTVAEIESNAPAIAFWRRVISERTHGAFSETWSDQQPRGPMQTFEIPAQ
ncbi:MAG: GNAT family N-acetyltransferase [Verrucomicrobiota bacterium]